MSFLATLGSYLAKGIALLSGLGPLVAPFLGSKAAVASNVETTIVNDLTSVGQVVLLVESLMQQPGSGTIKLAAATPLVVQILKTSELVSGHEIADETLFTSGTSDITSGVAKILNSLSNKNVKSSGVPIVVPTLAAAPAATTPAAPAPAAGIPGITQ